uniref:Uncharacterized protein n=1 Tax=viral metagenome TaxID=1070528 RepID=A0A6C0HYB1_9ZZZZ
MKGGSRGFMIGFGVLAMIAIILVIALSSNKTTLSLD